jgi:hypothetical protein
VFEIGADHPLVLALGNHGYHDINDIIGMSHEDIKALRVMRTIKAKRRTYQGFISSQLTSSSNTRIAAVHGVDPFVVTGNLSLLRTSIILQNC